MMKLEELKSHILRHMTAEQALTKLLESSLLQYEKLKFDDKGAPVHPIIIISMATMDLGWNFLLESEKVSKDIRGMAIGNMEYLDTLIKKDAQK